MPVMDGYESTLKILQEFRKLNPQGVSRNGNQLHVVAVTAFANDENVNKCFEVGMSDVIHKPLSNDMLRGVVEKYFYKQGND